ncbi:MAG: LysR family transcriptional regulator [Stenotrophomonas sp.]
MPRTVDIRRLRYFAAVVEHGGFAQAAASLHVTQPAVTMAVRKLEDEFGHRLIERNAKPIDLTSIGRAVYRSWQTHAAEQQRLARELGGMVDLNSATVSLVLGATFPMRPVVNALEILRSRYPGFRLSVRMGSYTGDLSAVMDGSVDMILSQLPAKGPDARFTHQSLISDRFRAVCRSSHPLARKSVLTWEDLVAYPWSGGGPFDAFLSGWSDRFTAHGVQPPEAILHTTSMVGTMASLLDHDYVAMLPVGCITEELSNGILRLLQVPGLDWPQEKGASWALGRSLSTGAAAYLEQLRNTLGFESGERGNTVAIGSVKGSG